MRRDEIVERMASVTDTPVMAYPNSGEMWDADRKVWTGDPLDGWGDGPGRWYRAGARILGGCCRTGPALVAG